jgi:SAM-dependent methyltransferase
MTSSTTAEVWNARYASETFKYGLTPNDFLKAQVDTLPFGGKVLCLAEGEGRNAVFLAERGFAVTGVDASERGLTKAQQLAHDRGVTISTVVADLNDFDLGVEQWDAVVSIWCHVPSALRLRLHPKIVAALRPGGVLVLEHYHPRQLSYGTGGPPDADFLLTRAELERDFRSLSVLHAFEGEREVHEGDGHSGLSFVTQFIAQRPGLRTAL